MAETLIDMGLGFIFGFVIGSLTKKHTFIFNININKNESNK